METLPLTEDDEALIAAATAVIQQNYVEGRHHVGAAVRGQSGRIFTGIHLESRVGDICAEPVALGAAASQGERVLETIVAVSVKGDGGPRVLSPCGACRELIIFYGPDTAVLFVEDGEVRKARAKDLLPGPYRNAE